MNRVRILRTHLYLYRVLFIVITLILILPSAGLPVPDSARFFRSGDGSIHIRNEHNKREARVNLFNSDGKLDEKALSEIDAVFGFSKNQKGEHISLRLLFFLDHFSDRIAPGKMIYLTSGYRSPDYNEKLKKSGGNVASTSTHMDGMALDFYLDGVKGKTIWEIIRKENCCGIGHYGGASVHLDSGKPRFWEAATSKTGTTESEFNRKIYLTTEFDRYQQGEKVRFFLTSLSDFQFGISKAGVLSKGVEGKNGGIELRIQGWDGEECMMVNDRDASRLTYTTLPAGLEPGRYRIRLNFCNRPFEQMPATTLSNEIEIIRK